jgi:hypothetical protein
VAVALALVAALGVGAAWVFERWVAPGAHAGPGLAPPPPAPPLAAAPPGADAGVAVVTAVEGLVERADREGAAWTPLRQGDRLAPDASLRTGASARADLEVGGADSRLTVAEGTELTVRELSRAAHAFRLSRGRVRVDYAESGARVLRVEAEDGAVAETRGARFTVLRSGTTVAVAAEAGRVDLSAAGGRVRLDAGQQSVAAAGAAPSPAAPIPLDVLLRVAQLSGSGAGGPCLDVEGRVRPGSELWADDAPVPVASDGRFRLRVARAPGRTAVRLRAREPSGRERAERVACRSGPGPGKDDEVRFRWE